MPTPSLTLWIDSSNSRIVSGWNSSAQLPALTFNQGDSIGVELHRVDATSGNLMSEVEFPVTGNITMAIGNIETAATSGSYVITYDDESTVSIAYNATAANIQTALNDLASITADGGVTVSLTGNIFRIIWNEDGVRSAPIAISSNNLFPSSTISTSVIRTGTLSARQITQIHAKQSPVAICTSWVNQDNATISYSQIHTPTYVGDVKVWRVKISPQPKSGTFLLSYVNGSKTYRSYPLDVNSSAGQVFDALAKLNANLEEFSVSKSGTYSWDISTLSTTVSNLTANGAGIVSFKCKYGVLSLNTVEVQDLLAGSASVSAYVEIELATDTTTTTLFQGTCLVLNDLIGNDGTTVVNRGDVMPVESVVRYDTSQSLTENQKTQARNNIDAIGAIDFVSFTAKDNELEARIAVAEGNLVTTNQANALNGSSSPSVSNVFITTSALTTAIAGKANTAHTHAIGDVTLLDYNLNLLQSNINTVTSALSTKSDTTHGHTIANIAGLQNDLDTLQNNIDAVDEFDLAINHTFSGEITFGNAVNFGGQFTFLADSSVQTTAFPPTGGTTSQFIDGTGALQTINSAGLSLSNIFSNYQTISQSSSANPSLSITQNGAGGGVLITNTGAGYSFKVEDVVSPDATPFEVSTSGRVGIGVAPDATVALTVDSTGIKVNGATLIPASAVSNPPVSPTYTKELLITINGVSYAIPLRVV